MLSLCLTIILSLTPAESWLRARSLNDADRIARQGVRAEVFITRTRNNRQETLRGHCVFHQNSLRIFTTPDLNAPDDVYAYGFTGDPETLTQVLRESPRRLYRDGNDLKFVLDNHRVDSFNTFWQPDIRRALYLSTSSTITGVATIDSNGRVSHLLLKSGDEDFWSPETEFSTHEQEFWFAPAQWQSREIWLPCKARLLMARKKTRYQTLITFQPLTAGQSLPIGAAQ